MEMQYNTESNWPNNTIEVRVQDQDQEQESTESFLEDQNPQIQPKRCSRKAWAILNFGITLCVGAAVGAVATYEITKCDDENIHNGNGTYINIGPYGDNGTYTGVAVYSDNGTHVFNSTHDLSNYLFTLMCSASDNCVTIAKNIWGTFKRAYEDNTGSSNATTEGIANNNTSSSYNHTSPYNASDSFD